MSVYLFKITEIDMISSFDVKPTFFLFQYNSNKAAIALVSSKCSPRNI